MKTTEHPRKTLEHHTKSQKPPWKPQNIPAKISKTNKQIKQQRRTSPWSCLEATPSSKELKSLTSKPAALILQVSFGQHDLYLKFSRFIRSNKVPSDYFLLICFFYMFCVFCWMTTPFFLGVDVDSNRVFCFFDVVAPISVLHWISEDRGSHQIHPHLPAFKRFKSVESLVQSLLV